MGRPRKVKVEVVEVPTAPVVETTPEVEAPTGVAQVTTRPSDGTVNDRVAPKLPSLDD